MERLKKISSGWETTPTKVHKKAWLTGKKGRLNKKMDTVTGNRKEKIQTDGQRHRSTEESSAWFATRFIGDSL